jgi:hypothetical protein
MIKWALAALSTACVLTGAAYLIGMPTAVRANLVQAPVGGGPPPPTWTLKANTFLLCADNPCNTNTSITTPPIDTTGSDLIVADVTFFANPPGAGCSTPNVFGDSKGNTWSTAKTVQNNGTSDGQLNLLYVQAPTVGSGHTFNFNKECFSSIYVLAFSGSVTSPLDVTNSGSNASTETSQASGSILPTQNGDLIITGLMGSGLVSGISVDSSIIQANAAGGGTPNENYTTGLGYFAQSTAATINPTWSWTTARSAAAAVASFKSH